MKCLLSTLLFIGITCLSAQEANVIFSASFNDNLLSDEGDAPAQATGVELVPGLLGNGVQVNGNGDRPRRLGRANPPQLAVSWAWEQRGNKANINNSIGE